MISRGRRGTNEVSNNADPGVTPPDGVGAPKGVAGIHSAVGRKISLAGN
jgi:hypothetical protein